jgi:urease accessory protein
VSEPVPARAVEHGGTGEPADTLTLAHESRHLRRAVLTADGGLRLLVDLPHATVLGEGDRLVLDDGRRVAVRAAAEDVLEVRGRDGLHLMRLAWHLGNRHLPTQIEADRLVIRADHVIAHMLEHQGARVTALRAPFVPEGGAYGHGTTHGHGH